MQRVYHNQTKNRSFSYKTIQKNWGINEEWGQAIT